MDRLLARMLWSGSLVPRRKTPTKGQPRCGVRSPGAEKERLRGGNSRNSRSIIARVLQNGHETETPAEPGLPIALLALVRTSPILRRISRARPLSDPGVEEPPWNSWRSLSRIRWGCRSAITARPAHRGKSGGFSCGWGRKQGTAPAMRVAGLKPVKAASSKDLNPKQGL